MQEEGFYHVNEKYVCPHLHLLNTILNLKVIARNLLGALHIK